MKSKMIVLALSVFALSLMIVCLSSAQFIDNIVSCKIESVEVDNNRVYLHLTGGILNNDRIAVDWGIEKEALAIAIAAITMNKMVEVKIRSNEVVVISLLNILPW